MERSSRCTSAVINMQLLILFLGIGIGCSSGKSVTEEPRRALVKVDSISGHIYGVLTFEQASPSSPVKIRGVIRGLKKGNHGMHVHEGLELGDKCQKVGSHFNPTGKQHGSPRDHERHVGDMGNFLSVDSGSSTRTEVNMISSLMSLYESSPTNIMNRAVVIHEKADDLGRGDSPQSLKNGNTGTIVACALITPVKEFPRDVEHSRRGHHTGVKDFKSTTTTKRDSLELESPVSTHKVWNIGQLYEYRYSGKISTGVNGISPKLAGGSISGRLLVQVIDDNTINLALREIESKMFNEDVMEDLVRVDPGTRVPTVDREMMERPIQASIVDGKVMSVTIDEDEPLWTVNLKRALVAQLQLQIDASSPVFYEAKHDTYNTPQKAEYSTMEASSSGMCETWYHISSIPMEQVNADPDLLPIPELCEGYDVYEIVKDRDLNKCYSYPMFNYRSTPGLKCNASDAATCQNMIAHADTVRIIGCRISDSFVVQRIISTDHLISKPMAYETEALEAISIQQFRLIGTKPSSTPMRSKSGRLYQSLTYIHDRSSMTMPLTGTGLPMMMDSDADSVVMEAQRLLIEIVQELDSEHFYAEPGGRFIAAKMDMLRMSLSLLDRDQLTQFINKYANDDSSSTLRQIAMDAVMLTGTNPAVMIVHDWILNGRLSGAESIEAISMLPATVKTPTRELLSTLMDYLKSDVVDGQQQLKIASALSITRLVHQVCINTSMSASMFPKLVTGTFCTADDDLITRHLVPWLNDQLRNATEDVERIAMLAALGNIGHEVILPVVLPFITSCQPGSSPLVDGYQRSIQVEGREQKEFNETVASGEKSDKWLEHKNRTKQKAKSSSATLHEMIEHFKRHHKQKRDEPYQDIYNEDIVSSIKDEAACTMIRSKAIFSLGNMAANQKEIIRTILSPVYFNKSEETQVRLAALTLLFASNPPAAFWQRVALSTWFESDHRVAQYIYTTITGLVTSKDPVSRQAIFRAESVQPMMKPMRWTYPSSVHYFKSGYEEKSRLGYRMEMTNFPGFESLLPSNHYNSLHLTLGPWVTRLLDISISSKQPEKLLDQLFGRTSPSQIHPDLEKMDDELQMKARATSTPEVFVYANLLDNYQQLMSLNPSTVEDIATFLVRKSFSKAGSSPMKVNYHKMLPLSDTFIRIPSSMGLAYSMVDHTRVMASLKTQLHMAVDMPAGVSTISSTIEGDVRTVMSVESSHEMAVEAPWSRSRGVAGVECHLHLALPVRLRLAADLPNSRFESSLKFLSEKVQIARHSVVPFTTVQNTSDFTPALLNDNARIVLLDQPSTSEYHFGDKTVGLNLRAIRRGDVGSLQKPSAFRQDWLGSFLFYAAPPTLRFHEYILYLDNAESDTDIITTSITFNAERSHEMLDSMSEPSGYSMNFKAEFINERSSAASRRFSTSMAYITGDYGQSHRARLLMKHQSERDSNFVVCGHLETTTPRSDVVRREGFTTEDMTRSSTVQIGFGKSCDEDRKITIETIKLRSRLFTQARMERNEEEMTSTVHSKWQDRECTRQELSGHGVNKECLSTRRLASILNKGFVTIDYNDMPDFVRNYTMQMATALSHRMGAYMSDNQLDVSNAHNQIRIETVYYPIIGSMDVRVYKPESNSFYHGIEIHPAVEAVLPFNPRLTTWRSVFGGPGLCLVDRNAVTTYDGLHYNNSMAGCDQVITEDCSGRYKMAVLAREENGNKVTTVYFNREKIEMNPAAMQLKVNGEDMRLPHNAIYQLKDAERTVLAEIRKTSDGFFHVDSPTHWVRVTCNAREIAVFSSPIHNGRLCGLCGTQTGDKTDDLVGPRKCSLPSDLMGVAYQLQQPRGCVQHADDRRALDLARSRCVGTEPSVKLASLSVHTRDVGDEDECTLQRNKMIHRGSRRCFSIDPLVKCSPICRPAQVKQVNIGFHCVPNGPLSDQLRDAAKLRPLTEMAGQEVTNNAVFEVPTSCVPIGPTTSM